MKKIIILLVFIFTSMLSWSQTVIDQILEHPSTCFFELDIDSDEFLIVQNYTDSTDSFIILELTEKGRWIILDKTTKLLPFKIARGNGTINSNYYRYVYKSIHEMPSIDGFSKHSKMIAILSSSEKKIRANFHRQTWDLIIDIYEENSINGIGDVGRVKKFETQKLDLADFPFLRDTVIEPEMQVGEDMQVGKDMHSLIMMAQMLPGPSSNIRDAYNEVYKADILTPIELTKIQEIVGKCINGKFTKASSLAKELKKTESIPEMKEIFLRY